MADIRASQILAQVEYFVSCDYTGDVTTILTPESVYMKDYVYTGDVTATLTPESTYISPPNYEYAGDVTVELIPESTYMRIQNYEYAGDVTVALIPESTYVSPPNYEYAGDVTVELIPESIYFIPPNYEYTGDVTVTLIPESTYRGTFFDFIGDVSINLILESPTIAYYGEYKLTSHYGVNVSGASTIVFEDPSQFEVIGEEGVLVSGEGVSEFELPPEYEILAEGGLRISSNGESSHSYPKTFDLVASGGILANYAGIIDFFGRDDIPSLNVIATGGISVGGRGLCDLVGIDDLKVLEVIATGGINFNGSGIVSFPHPRTYQITSTAKLSISGSGIFETQLPAKVLTLVSSGGLNVNGLGFTVFNKPQIFNIVSSGGIVIGRPIDISKIYYTWVVNGKTFEPSIYSGFNFNSYATYRGMVYGLKDDGLYLIGGDNDAGKDIHTGIDIKSLNLGNANRKKLRSIRVANQPDNVNVKISDGTRDGYYTIKGNRKAVISRAIRGDNLSLKIADFSELDTTQLEIMDRGY